MNDASRLPRSACPQRRPAPVIAALLALALSSAGTSAQEQPGASAGDAFGLRIGNESLGLYSESLVRGFDLQQAGNYRLDDSYFVRAAAPPDTIVAGSQIRVGPGALPIDFPAPSGIVQYRLLPADHDRQRLEIGFQHLLDSNPRPHLRAHFARRREGSPFSIAGGAIGASSARYIFGNTARYHGIGLVPRLELGQDWRLTAFHGVYRQRYQADVAFRPAQASLPRPDRLTYLGQRWSRFDTRNTTYGAILATRPRPGRWDYRLSGVHSRVDRPRSDLNLFSEVEADGDAQASILVAHGRKVFSRAFEASAARDWNRRDRHDELTLLARWRDSDYRSPRVRSHGIGRVSLFDPVPQLPQPVDPPGPQAGSSIGQREIGIGWRHRRHDGVAVHVGLRRTELEESARSIGGIASTRDSAAWLYNASLSWPLSGTLAAFASTVRGIEEAGVAPQHASNAFEVLPPALARQSELGLRWSPGAGGATVIGTLFDIRKSEPGFAADGRFAHVGQALHRGVEVSLRAQARPGLTLLAGGVWLRPRLQGEAVEAGLIGPRPVGRPGRLLLASADYRPPGLPAWSFDADATYTGWRAADTGGVRRTPGYTLWNAGLRYRFRLGATPAALRLRVLNLTDRYAWIADGGGLQAYEPARRVTLSLILGE